MHLYNNVITFAIRIQIIPSLLMLLRDYCNTHPASTTAASTNSTATTSTTNSKSNGNKVGEEEEGITAVKKYAALTAQRVLKVLHNVYYSHLLPTHTHSCCYLSLPLP